MSTRQTFLQLYINVHYDQVNLIALYREGDNLNRIHDYPPEERAALEAILIREAWNFKQKGVKHE